MIHERTRCSKLPSPQKERRKTGAVIARLTAFLPTPDRPYPGTAFTRTTLAAAFLLLLLGPGSAHALFDLAVIDEVMTSYGGDPNVQFVEIKQLAIAQNFVANSVLAVFDATGTYIGDLLVVPGNVVNSGAGVRWIMATTAFQTVSGLTPDFIMPAGLPTGGGMVCWGAPGLIPPLPASWDHTIPANYVDCLAYGTYSGPSNIHVGTPTSLDSDGHSLARLSDTNDNATDFACADPATPTNNGGSSASLAATTPCFGDPCATLGGDTDGDTICDDDDPCISFPLSDPLDSNGDGIPDECQCGDVAPLGGDGLLGFDDATGFAQCFITGGTTGAFTCTQLPLGKGDTQRDGLWGFDDATNAAQAFIGAIPTFSLTCEARPEGTPPPPPF